MRTVLRLRAALHHEKREIGSAIADLSASVCGRPQTEGAGVFGWNLGYAPAHE